MRPLLLTAYALFSLALGGVASATLWWMLHAWRTPDVLHRTGFTVAQRPPRLSFSLIVPGRHEEAVMGATLDRLMASDHPDFEGDGFVPVRQALDHSVVVASFGHDTGTVQVRRIVGAGPRASLGPKR